MAKSTKKVAKKSATKSQKKGAVRNASSSPFRDVKELRAEITLFLNTHRARIQNQATRISDYFEMCCFNYVVKFYERNKYTVGIKNLQKGKYRYKCSTQGNQENFSFFEVVMEKDDKNYAFQIHHNLAVQSSHELDIYTTPDITVIKPDSIKIDEDFYGGNKKLSYVENLNLVTFCEVKQFNPFPELLFNFIGTVNEIKHDIMCDKFEKAEPIHIAPSLMISGKPNQHATKIKTSLEKRYCINVLFDLFSSGSAQFTTAQVGKLRKIEKIMPVAAVLGTS